MMMMLLMIMKNDCYLDDDEEEDLIWNISTIYWKQLSSGMSAPNWIFTHLKCIANASYLMCIAVHFLKTHLANKIRTSANARTKQAGFKMQL